MRVTAAVLYAVNKPYSVETVDLDAPRRGEVLIINRAYEDIDTDAVGRGMIVFP